MRGGSALSSAALGSVAAALGLISGFCLVLQRNAAAKLGPVELLGARQQALQFTFGQSYPYIKTPYSDSARPYGMMEPYQYPLYPYQTDEVHPLYESYGATKKHDWFSDNTVDAKGSDPEWTTKDWWAPVKSKHAETEKGAVVEGGQYQSPVLPDDSEDHEWNLFGQGFQDHTYVPQMKARAQQQLRMVPQELGNNGLMGLRETWSSLGQSNNYQGMTEPIEENNPLGDHVVGSNDREVKTEEAEREYGGVVDPALRTIWDAFSGELPAERFEPPKIGASLDNHIACAEENDPSLCDDARFNFRPVSNTHTNPNVIPSPPAYKSSHEKGVYRRKGSGILPAGGGAKIYGGRKGDLVKDCTDPNRCHTKPNFPQSFHFS